MEVNRIIQQDVSIGIPLPDNSIDCCVTSPPYYGLRDYDHTGQLGLEETPELYMANMVKVFEEVRRVLKPNGTCWLNLGDSYAANGISGLHTDTGKSTLGPNKNGLPGNRNWSSGVNKKKTVPNGLKPKDLIGIPWMVAFALRSAGWYLRQDIIWSKPNPMPESVTDRCTKAHEYIFLLSKSAKYYYDAEAIKDTCLTNDNSNRDRENSKLNNTPGRSRMAGLVTNNYEFANKRSVWTVTTKPFSECHFATFPQDLIVDMIKAGCPEGGTVLDPFMGAGTTGLVARKLNRNYIGFEINPEYIRIAERRIISTIGLFI